MDHLKGLDMKGPVRPAPAVPAFAPTRYSPVTNWNDDPFSADLFEPAPSFQQKKKPPPRPPPPKLQPKTQPDIPVKPSHFNRKPTILSSLMTRKERAQKTTTTVQSAVHQKFSTEFHNEVVAQNMFPKCESKNIQTASLIDLSSPPSSPTFTTRSSSDGLSIDSFGSDATSSTNQLRAVTGSASQAESGFEDDFDLFLSSRKTISKEDTMDDFANFDPFSPIQMKPPILTKPAVSKGFSEQLLCNGKTVQQSVHTHKVPTIIRAKPARPKPPENSALLRMSLASQSAMPPMNLNMSVPIQRVNTGMDYYRSDIALATDTDWSPEREDSPPMPSVPPPPPPVLDDSDPLPDPLLTWPSESDSAEELPVHNPHFVREASIDIEEPYAISLYDYIGEHPDDLSFDANVKVKLLRRVDAEWLYGRLRSGAEGVFPANRVEVRVPLPGESLLPPRAPRPALALHDFRASHPGDLPFAAGDTVLVLDAVNDEWYYGECAGRRGQFPANYVHVR